jgi:hypothetical protein
LVCSSTVYLYSIWAIRNVIDGKWALCVPAQPVAVRHAQR